MKNYRLLFISIIIIVITLGSVVSYKFVFEHSLKDNNTQSNNFAFNHDINNADLKKNHIKNTEIVHNQVDNSTNMQCLNKVHITPTEFINNQQCKNYTLKSNETINDLYKTFDSSCSYNAFLKLVKEINKLNSINDIKSGCSLYIPETTLKNGTIHKVVSGDTWFDLCSKYYSEYDPVSIMNLLIYINDFKDDTLPLDAYIFLPKI